MKDPLKTILANIEGSRRMYDDSHAFGVPAWKSRALRVQTQMLISLDRYHQRTGVK